MKQSTKRRIVVYSFTVVFGILALYFYDRSNRPIVTPADNPFKHEPRNYLKSVPCNYAEPCNTEKTAQEKAQEAWCLNNQDSKGCI